jgi:hypothetical protein
MRQRRLLVAALVLALAGGAAGASIGLVGSSSGSPGSPFSGQAARKALCGSPYILGCHSPDGAWSIKVRNQGFGCTLSVFRLRTGHRAWAYHSHDGGCDPPIWLEPHLLVFRHNANRPPDADVISLDPATRKVALLARFTSYVVSPDERWVAGEAGLRSNGTPRLIAVLSLESHACRVVTRAHGPNQDIRVDQSPWPVGANPALTETNIVRRLNYPSSVSWRTVLIGHVKVRVASGPGAGFTRDSSGVIVSESRLTSEGETGKRLLRFGLSSLHAPCPADLVPHI